jgi:hypothetical protein
VAPYSFFGDSFAARRARVGLGRSAELGLDTELGLDRGLREGACAPSERKLGLEVGIIAMG